MQRGPQVPAAAEVAAGGRDEVSESDYGERTRLAVRVVMAARPEMAQSDALSLVLRVMAN